MHFHLVSSCFKYSRFSIKDPLDRRCLWWIKICYFSWNEEIARWFVINIWDLLKIQHAAMLQVPTHAHTDIYTHPYWIQYENSIRIHVFLITHQQAVDVLCSNVPSKPIALLFYCCKPKSCSAGRRGHAFPPKGQLGTDHHSVIPRRRWYQITVIL